ncbi:MFS transporter superfamily [Sesbania bispinosa]|nr:MFS transporter superfamily [Sesbania bispinosa]
MREENMREPLLEKQYYKDCPGCKVEQAKELNKGVSIKNLLIMWMVVLCATLPTSSLFPFLYFMVRDFNIAETEADISSYAGYVGSTFMLGRCLTSVLWGIVADRYGRKPCHLQHTIWPQYKFLDGYFYEISSRKFQWYTWTSEGQCSLGHRFNHWASIGRLFGSGFHTSCPALIISGLAFAAAIVCIWIPETLHNHNGSNESTDDAEALENGSKRVFSLWAVSPSRLGGLNFTTDGVGDVLAVTGLSLIIYQLAIYPFVERTFGPIAIARITGMFSIPLLQSYPFIAMLSGVTLYIVISIASMLKNLLAVTIITGLFLLQNRAVVVQCECSYDFFSFCLAYLSYFKDVNVDLHKGLTFQMIFGKKLA